MIKENMHKAYSIANELLRDKLKEEAPDILADLDDINESDVIVTVGQHDRIESVFSKVNTPHNLIRPEQLRGLRLDPDQIVFVNCPGNFDDTGLRKLNQFVENGGFLFTTDWALKHVLERAFPGYVRYNNQSTTDEVVRVEVLSGDDPFLNSILGPDDDPQWWLEGSSYPIEILKKNEVEVLVTSREIKEKYGESPVFITFNYGKGRIYHMISHFYLQRAETRTKRHSLKGSEYLKEKNISGNAAFSKYQDMGIDGENLGDIEAAYSSSAMLNKILYEKKRAIRRNEKGKQKPGGNE